VEDGQGGHHSDDVSLVFVNNHNPYIAMVFWIQILTCTDGILPESAST
jgi:hypothetical protein